MFFRLLSLLLSGERRYLAGEKGFVYFSLPLRMFCSLLQNTDNQNVLEGEREREREREGEGMKTRIDLAHMLCRSAMLSRART